MPLDPNALCTVCIPTYNQARYLRAAVRSVAEQTVAVRLLVSNDASPDDTAAVLVELQKEFRFEAVSHAVNRGISMHLQWLLAQPDTPFILRLDSDDLLHPAYIEELSELLLKHPKAGYAHAAIQLIDDKGVALEQRHVARSTGFEDAETSLKKLIFGYQVAANIVMFRREALESVAFGAGSEHLNFVEDYDMSVRLADAGWGNVYSGNVLASYRVWTDAGRPKLGRKLTEVRGLAQIFSGSLASAFTRRHWSQTPLLRRRRQLALYNSDILDRVEFASGEREQMVAALSALSGARDVALLLAPTPFSTLLRKAFTSGVGVKQRAKLVIKKALFGRR